VSPSGKRATQIARAIADSISEAGWPVGAVIGTEATIMAKYGVSRAVTREAIRLVEHHHVAVMRRGPGAGLVVQAPDPVAVTDACLVYLEQAGTTVSDLFEARRLLEPLAAAMASTAISEDGILRLRSVAAEPPEVLTGRHLSPTHGKLHITLAEMSGNPVLTLFVDILVRLTDRFARLPHVTDSVRTKADDAAVDAHCAIVDAIVADDLAAAQHRMAVHLSGIARWLADPTLRIATARAIDVRLVAGTDGRKLAEVIADAIRSDITFGTWQIGAAVGSEADLLERYRVSRAVLREAIRILEYHSVARMRSGPGGGLIVTRRDPDASIEAMTLYLDYRGATANHIFSVRKALELGVLDSVMERAADAEIADRLSTALKVMPQTPVCDVNRLSHELHLTLAEMSGNPVLEFFVRTITSLWARRGTGIPGQEPIPPEEAAGAVWRAHGAIVEAILAGDHSLARHRMLRHLEALPAWWH
jgi:DNA-binding FadR family transcriptional regulator